mmetsp:Transcript_94719/g.282880  ORF Transcript_94719/g.282880 Transcript_94719/m.282880 type:complete len:207 (-) Transcript_94719:1176-1796(-)
MGRRTIGTPTRRGQVGLCQSEGRSSYGTWRRRLKAAGITGTRTLARHLGRCRPLRLPCQRVHPARWPGATAEARLPRARLPAVGSSSPRTGASPCPPRPRLATRAKRRRSRSCSARTRARKRHKALAAMLGSRSRGRASSPTTGTAARATPARRCLRARARGGGRVRCRKATGTTTTRTARSCPGSSSRACRRTATRRSSGSLATA